jgi:hypothetical protein
LIRSEFGEFIETTKNSQKTLVAIAELLTTKPIVFAIYFLVAYLCVLLLLKAVLGNLPDDFLRPDNLLGSSPSHQERIDRELAIQLHQQQRVANIQYVNQSYAGQLIITIVEVIIFNFEPLYKYNSLYFVISGFIC